MNQEDHKALEVVRDDFQVTEGHLIDQASSTFRWLMGTLFAANGGALIALADYEYGDGTFQLYAIGCFAAGVVLSLLMGAASTFAGIQAVANLRSIRFKAEQSLFTGELDKPEMLAALGALKPSWKTWTPSYIGMASLISFVAGLVLAALSIA